MPENQPKSKLRLIVSSHSESLHNTAGMRIDTIWASELKKTRSQILKKFGNTAEINLFIDKHLAKYDAKKEFLSYNLLEKVDYYAYYDPALTERGIYEAYFCGKLLKDYLETKKLSVSKYAFSTPYARTLSSVREMLRNFEEDSVEILVIPDLMEPFGRFVDKFSQEKSHSNYRFLDEGINIDLIMYNSESDLQIGRRIKKGLEKIHKYSGKETESTITMVMCQGGIMKILSRHYLDMEVQKIENPELWDLILSFDQKGNLQNMELIEKIIFNEHQRVSLKNTISKIQPSEEFITNHDFSVMEDALSWLARDAKEEITNLWSVQSIKPKNKVNPKHNQSCNTPNLEALAKKPLLIGKYAKKKLGKLKITRNQPKTFLNPEVNPLRPKRPNKTATPIELIILCLFNRGMNISDIKELLFEIYGCRISLFSISIIINRLQNEQSSAISGL